MRFLYVLIFAFSALPSLAQDTELNSVPADSLAIVPDPLYREDQFYISFAYNLLQSSPKGFSQNALPLNLTVGFLRDMPLNAARTHAVALGLGYSFTNLKQNLLITEDAGTRTYEVEQEGNFENNKLVLHYVEVPLEFRWRNSDSISHKFWRIYAGVKVSYLFADKSQYELAGTKFKVKGNDDLNRIAYGVYLAIGWNTWNFYANYGITPLFDKAILFETQEKVKLNSLNLGVMFYIL